MGRTEEVRKVTEPVKIQTEENWGNNVQELQIRNRTAGRDYLDLAAPEDEEESLSTLEMRRQAQNVSLYWKRNEASVFANALAVEVAQNLAQAKDQSTVQANDVAASHRQFQAINGDKKLSADALQKAHELNMGLAKAVDEETQKIEAAKTEEEAVLENEEPSIEKNPGEFFQGMIDKAYAAYVRELSKGEKADPEALYRWAMDVCILIMHSEASRKHKESLRETDLTKAKVIDMQKTFNTPGATVCTVLSMVASFAGAACAFSGVFAKLGLTESVIKTLNGGSQSLGYVSQGFSSSGQLIEKDAEKTRIMDQYYRDLHQRLQQEAGHSRDEKKQTKGDVIQRAKDMVEAIHRAREGILAN